MLVICIDDNWTYINETQGHHPVKGNVYTVVEISDEITGKTFLVGDRMLTFIGQAYRLAESVHPTPTNKTWWSSLNFRPCKETDISVFQEILTKTRPQTVNAQ